MLRSLLTRNDKIPIVIFHAIKRYEKLLFGAYIVIHRCIDGRCTLKTPNPPKFTVEWRKKWQKQQCMRLKANVNIIWIEMLFQCAFYFCPLLWACVRWLSTIFYMQAKHWSCWRMTPKCNARYSTLSVCVCFFPNFNSINYSNVHLNFSFFSLIRSLFIIRPRKKKFRRIFWQIWLHNKFGIVIVCVFFFSSLCSERCETVDSFSIEI